MTTDTDRVGRRIGEGVVAGLFAGTVFAAIMIALHGGSRVWVALKLAAYPFLGGRVMLPRYDTTAVVLGLLCHFGVAIAWGVLFALLVHGFSRGTIVVLGAVWGVVVWLVMFAIVLPAVAPKLAEGGGSFGNLLIHVLFGIALGVGLLPFEGTVTETHHWWHSPSLPAGHAA
jgi:hypothetical protein